MARIQGDADLHARLAAAGFEGPDWDRFADVLVEYGWAALKARAISVLSVIGWVGVIARGNGIAVPNAAVRPVDYDLTTTEVPDDLLGSPLCVSLRLSVCRDPLGVRSFDIPSPVRVGNYMTVVAL